MAALQRVSSLDQSMKKERDVSTAMPCSRCKTSTRHNIVARTLCYLADLDDMFFSIASCGLWTNTILHFCLVLLYAAQSAPTIDVISWSLATGVWGILALAIYFLKSANRGFKFLGSKSNNLSTLIANALILVAFMSWYTDAIVQNTSPFEQVFKECMVRSNPFTQLYWSSHIFTLTKCDLASAIANVTWLGPIALLMAIWAILFAWISRSGDGGQMAAEVSSSSDDEKEMYEDNYGDEDDDLESWSRRSIYKVDIEAPSEEILY